MRSVWRGTTTAAMQQVSEFIFGCANGAGQPGGRRCRGIDGESGDIEQSAERLDVHDHAGSVQRGGGFGPIECNCGDTDSAAGGDSYDDGFAGGEGTAFLCGAISAGLRTVPAGHLLQIALPQSSQVLGLSFVRLGHSSEECGNVDAVVPVLQGATRQRRSCLSFKQST